MWKNKIPIYEGCKFRKKTVVSSLFIWIKIRTGSIAHSSSCKALLDIEHGTITDMHAHYQF